MNSPQFKQFLRAKAAHRQRASQLTWEEKVKVMERMRAVGAKPKLAMREARQRRLDGNVG